MRPAKWNFEVEFHTEVQLKDFLMNEGCWSIRTSSMTERGHKTVYRCKHVKKRSSTQCAASIYTLRNDVTNDGSDSEHAVYSVYRKEAAHTHEGHTNQVTGLKPAIRQKIIEYHKNGKLPMSIFYEMVDDKDIAETEKPSLRAIRNAIAKFKKDEFGAEPLTMRSLKNFVAASRNIPDDEDEAFVLNFYRSPPNQREDKWFTIVISTPRLLKKHFNIHYIHADGTEKMTSDKLSAIVVGSTDTKRTFHLIGLAITVKQTADVYKNVFTSIKDGIKTVTGIEIQPKALICDADPSIPSGYFQVFDRESTVLIMCYAHVMENVQRKYKFKDSVANKERTKAD